MGSSYFNNFKRISSDHMQMEDHKIDSMHSAKIKQMRDDRHPITRKLLSCYKRLSITDVQKDPRFEFAPVLFPTNVERASVIKNIASHSFCPKTRTTGFILVDQYRNVPAASKN